MKILIQIFVLLLLLKSCKNEQGSNSSKKIIKILQDTTNNDKAKWDLEQLEHYNNICKEIGLNKLEDGADSLEVRVWQQLSIFGMATDEEMYSIKVSDSNYYLTYYRIYCTRENYDNENYNKWNAFKKPKIDSFIATSKTINSKQLKELNLERVWNIKTQSEIKIPDTLGFTDGTVTSIEIANKEKYKLIRHHQAHSYYRVTKNQAFKDYMDERDKLIEPFYKNKIFKDY
jgi:hypothetical protein